MDDRAKALRDSLVESRYDAGVRLSRRGLAKVGKKYREKTGEGVRLSRGALASEEAEVRAAIKQRLDARLVGAFRALYERYGKSLQPRLVSTAHVHLVGVLYLDGYAPGNAFRKGRGRVQMTLGGWGAGCALRALPAADMHKDAFKRFWISS
eukprot:TRINITY_DN7526_c0_g2_i1.p2 TRINITY_DN7526_c0_g2~~TRINITY_DN7526_c0_g2_i1.p2  ORF type:complete len:152 (-),score=26.95 TRINITY_DN7526_c0_g2_i1:472-927(-)